MAAFSSLPLPAVVPALLLLFFAAFAPAPAATAPSSKRPSQPRCSAAAPGGKLERQVHHRRHGGGEAFHGALLPPGAGPLHLHPQLLSRLLPEVPPQRHLLAPEAHRRAAVRVHRQRGRHRVVRRQHRLHVRHRARVRRPSRLHRASVLPGVEAVRKRLIQVGRHAGLPDIHAGARRLRRPHHQPQAQPLCRDSPVVVFGGSYGGMLASWFRLKYQILQFDDITPWFAMGAVASSAPILQFDDITPWSSFYDTISQDFKSESMNCFSVIKAVWDVLDDRGSNDTGLLELSKTFRACKTVHSVYPLGFWLRAAFTTTAMADYPTPANFMMNLPAFPVKRRRNHSGGG